MYTLTVDDDDLHHGNGEEGLWRQWNTDEDGGRQEHDHDDQKTSCYTQPLGNAESNGWMDQLINGCIN